VQALREDCAPAVNADDRDRASFGRGFLSDRVLLDDLVCDPHERAAHVIAIEDDRALLQTCLLLPGLAGPG
jgi:hypothetical protein